MDDIVERLRIEYGDTYLIDEAANEIEALRARVKVYETPSQSANDAAHRMIEINATYGEIVAAVERHARTEALKPFVAFVGALPLGTYVEKQSGSHWAGTIVGYYSTSQTPLGYAVESVAHKSAVQIYPAKTLSAIGGKVIEVK